MEEITREDQKILLDDAYSISKKLIEAFGYQIALKDDTASDIFNFFEKHIRAAIIRSRNGIKLQNVLIKEIKVTIPLMFDFVKVCMREIQSHYDVIFDEDELAYIAMYLEILLNSSLSDENQLNILFICSFGFASSSIIKARITQILPGNNFIGPMSPQRAREYLKENKVEFAISTVDFDGADCPVVVIDPLVSQKDIDALQRILFQLSYKMVCQNVLSLYSTQRAVARLQHRISDYMTAEDVQIVGEARDWVKAIRLAATPLLRKKTITPQYVERMVQAVHEYGTYMVLTPKVAYVHAGTTDGIAADCAALLITKKPMMFGDFNIKEIHAIVVIGVKDKEKTNLLNLASILERPENIKVISSPHVTVDEILHMGC